MKLIDRYNAAYAEIEKTKEITKGAVNQVETNPAKDTAKEHITSFMTRHGEITQELAHILTEGMQLSGDLSIFADSLHQLITFGGLPTHISVIFCSGDNF